MVVLIFDVYYVHIIFSDSKIIVFKFSLEISTLRSPEPKKWFGNMYVVIVIGFVYTESYRTDFVRTFTIPVF